MVGAVVASHGGSVGGYTTAYAVIGVIALAIAVGGLFLKDRASERETAGAAAPSVTLGRSRNHSADV